jgi:MFS family permease
VASPFLGRFVDQNGPRKLMIPMGIAHAFVLVCLVACAHWRVPPPYLMALAFLGGLTFPPVSMTTRAMWRKANLPDNTKQLGFALEGVIMETVFVCGPLLVSFFLLIKLPSGALLFSALLMLVGITLYSRSGALERWGQVEQVKRHWLGPLKVKGVRRALMVSPMLGATFGLQELGMIAMSTAANKEALVGWFFTIYSIPSAIAGLIYGTKQLSWPLNKQLTFYMLWICLLTAGMALVPYLADPAFAGQAAIQWGHIGLFSLLCFICGGVVGPAITASQIQMGRLTPVEYSTEAFTWSMTLFMVALGGAFSLGGILTEKLGAHGPLAAATLTAFLGAIFALRIPPVAHLQAH